MMKFYVYINMNWTDNRILINKTFDGQKAIITSVAMKKLWTPDVLFDPAEDAQPLSEMGSKIMYVNKNDIMEWRVM